VKATNVIARFLSLLDVALILLGVLMIILIQSQIRGEAQQGHAAADGLAKLAGIDFVYLYAGWKGYENGRCYLLTADGTIGREVRTDTAADIQQVLSTRSGHNERPHQIVMLLFSDDGWYSAWDPDRLAKIEKTWKLRLTPVYNVRLPR
jgi:hypothetical protein